MLVGGTSQEHGLLGRREGQPPDLRVGDRVRVYPSHACITAACHARYLVADGREVVDRWPRVNGW